VSNEPDGYLHHPVAQLTPCHCDPPMLDRRATSRPSAYISLAESDCSFKLGAELAAACFDVDLNRVS
jgi:hypothetical protein